MRAHAPSTSRASSARVHAGRTTARASRVVAMATEGKTRVAIAGGGLWGTAIAYFCQKSNLCDVTLVERERVASAASGKGGGFLARDWGDGSPTEPLHKRAFELHETLAGELELETYRKIPTLSVVGGQGLEQATPLVSWLDGDIAMCRMMDEFGTAQVTPRELCEKFHDAAGADALGEKIAAAYAAAYAGAPFVRLLKNGALPDTKNVNGTNVVEIAWRIDVRTGRLIVMSAEDNLIKGASGQAVQSMNLACGFEQTAGLI